MQHTFSFLMEPAASPLVTPPRVAVDRPTIAQFSTIYLEPQVRNHPRGQAILASYPDAQQIEVASHWGIPDLQAGAVGDWMRVKRQVLVLGMKKQITVRPNGRSADFISPSISNGCAMACAYCYVARHKGHANPITTFVNIEGVLSGITRHVQKLGPKPTPNQVDPTDWVYDLGENGDLSVDAWISDNVRDLVDLFKTLPGAKGSFATKRVNRDLLDYDPQGKTRIRFSLMPDAQARLVDVRTSPISARIGAINDFVRAGYEVHLNFSPVIVEDGWERAWDAMLEELADRTDAAAQAQWACEVIFLTHNRELHDVNVQWHPKGEGLLWRPDLQEDKISGNGQHNVRYRTPHKAGYVRTLEAMIARRLPGCRVRCAV